MSASGSSTNHHPLLTSKHTVSLRFYWQGYETLVRHVENENVVPCLYRSDDVFERDVFDELKIIPLRENPDRRITHDMQVQVQCARTGQFLRGAHMSKFLRWSSTRDQQTIFRVHTNDRSTLSHNAPFYLSSDCWENYMVGITQQYPLGGKRALSGSVGFLTLEKKKHQPPLIFPLRFRAYRLDVSDDNVPHVSESGPTIDIEASDSDNSEPTEQLPMIQAHELRFFGREEETLALTFPTANILEEPDTPQEISLQPDIHQSCSYCGMMFYYSHLLLAHIENLHEDVRQRVPISGTFCTGCGTRRVEGACPRCEHQIVAVPV